jgi:hypothetical protein
MDTLWYWLITSFAFHPGFSLSLDTQHLLSVSFRKIFFSSLSYFLSALGPNANSYDVMKATHKLFWEDCHVANPNCIVSNPEGIKFSPVGDNMMTFWEAFEPFRAILGRVTCECKRTCNECKYVFDFSENFDSIAIHSEQLFQDAHTTPTASVRQTRRRKLVYKEPTLQEMVLHSVQHQSTAEGKNCPQCSSLQYGQRHSDSGRVDCAASITSRRLSEISGTLFILYNLLHDRHLMQKLVTPEIPVVLQLVPESFYLHSIILHLPDHWACIQYIHKGQHSGYYMYDGATTSYSAKKHSKWLPNAKKFGNRALDASQVHVLVYRTTAISTSRTHFKTTYRRNSDLPLHKQTNKKQKMTIE